MSPAGANPRARDHRPWPQVLSFCDIAHSSLSCIRLYKLSNTEHQASSVCSLSNSSLCTARRSLSLCTSRSCQRIDNSQVHKEVPIVSPFPLSERRYLYLLHTCRDDCANLAQELVCRPDRSPCKDSQPVARIRHHRLQKELQNSTGQDSAQCHRGTSRTSRYFTKACYAKNQKTRKV